MDPFDRQEPWKRDDVLVSAMSVGWIAKNNFLVAVPSYRRQLSCELTAVDVPRGTSPALLDTIKAILHRVNSAMRLYLRQDFYSNFPLEGFGDIIFSAETKNDVTASLHWCSLQETLVRAGAACVVRPSVLRLVPLLAAEEGNAPLSSGAEKLFRNSDGGGGCSIPLSPWLHELRTRERSSLRCVVRRCVVEDVLRGDVYRVSWQPLAPTGEGEADSLSALSLPPLLILESTVCHAVSTEPGFAALRWAQLHLLHRELVVDVHAVYPCDKDVAFNTQLETYEHLANVRGSARVVDGAPGDSGGSGGDLVDVGAALLSRDLCWVRRVSDAGDPRASNLFSIHQRIEEVMTDLLTRQCSADTTAPAAPESNAVACAALGKAWSVPASAAAALLTFHDPWWRCAVYAQLRRREARSYDDATTLRNVGGTAATWNRYVWCGDLHHDPNDEPRVHVDRPLRTLFPLAGLAQWRVRLRGYVCGAVLVRLNDGRRFLQVEVAATTSAAEWRDLRRLYGYADLDVVCFSPMPADAVLGKKVKVMVSASGLSEDAETRLRVCCTSYPAATFSLAQHTPSSEWAVKEGGWCEEELSVVGSVKEERAFVLDVVAETRDEECMSWTQRGTGRAVYVLSPDFDTDAADDAENNNDDDRNDAAVAGTTNDYTDAALKKKSVGGVSATVPTLAYTSKMSFFFELRPDAADSENAGADKVFLDDLRRTFHALMYEEVVLLPVGVAEVCGTRGLVGDLFFPVDEVPRCTAAPLRDRPAASFQRSLLTSIGRSWWCTDAAPSWSMGVEVYEAVQASFRVCMAKVAEEEAVARQSFIKEVEWHYRVLDQEALNLFPTYRTTTPFVADRVEPPARPVVAKCLRYSAGDAVLWRDGTATTASSRLCLPASLIPPTVPLSVFAVRPRELISVAVTQKTKTVGVPKKTAAPRTLMEKTYEQQDWAFMRLNFPFLPNILRCDWERLPLSMRNTERALCEAVCRNPRLVPRPGMLFSTDRIFSLLLSYLALLQSMQLSRDSNETTSANGADGSSALKAVYQAMRQSTPSFWDDCNAAMHFSATLFVLPPYRRPGDPTKAVPHSRPLFLGSRANVVSDAFEVPRSDNAAAEIVPFPLLRALTVQCVSAMAFETLVTTPTARTGHNTALPSSDSALAATTPVVAVENLVEGREPSQMRTIAATELPWGFAEASTPVLYHPLPRVAVLASPLVEREEYSVDTLGRLNLDHDIFAQVKNEPTETTMVRRTVALQYNCVGMFSEKNPYKTVSYGRISSRDMFKNLLNERARGREVQAYMSLLLRRNNTGGADADTPASPEKSTALPDGLLSLYGVPSEALYLHYRSRADLRFTLSTVCPPLQEALLDAEKGNADSQQRAAAVDAAETRLFTSYVETAAAAMRKIYERVRSEQKSDDVAEQISLVFTLQPWDDAAPPYVAVQVFPIYASDSETTTRVLDQESIWHNPEDYCRNPHKAFTLLGSRFGRLASAELRIRYDAAASAFSMDWNALFERNADLTSATATSAPTAGQ